MRQTFGFIIFIMHALLIVKDVFNTDCLSANYFEQVKEVTR
jgi:hypothetical protein